jgi:WD40 repeat protein
VVGVSRYRSCRTLIGLLFFAGVSGPAAQNPKSDRRNVTVSDAIQMTVWADLQYFLGGAPEDRVGIFSPDGEQFVIVVRRGNLEDNSNEYSLLLFRTSDAFNGPKPEVLITMSSSSNREAVENVKWLSDNETVVFLGEKAGAVPEIYSLNTKTKRLVKLTNHPTPIVAYDIDPSGTSIVYEAVPQRVRTSDSQETKRNGVVISTQNPSDLFLSECTESQQLDRADK